MKHYGYLQPLTKTMPRKEARLLVSLLRELRETATMKNADFPQELKDKTRLWRNTWLVSPLDDLIERYEAIS